MEGKGRFPTKRLKFANQAEILRSHQRDDDFVNSLREKFLEILKSIGKKNEFLYLAHTDVPFRLIYFIFTCGLGNQTLGEEYTGIVQANLDACRVPPLSSRLLAAILECFGERILTFVLNEIRRSTDFSLSGGTKTKSELAALLRFSVTKLCAMVPTLILAHKGLFYIYGRYYSWGKRVAGIDYAKVYGHRPTHATAWGLKLLGVATLLQAGLKIYQNAKSKEPDADPIPTLEDDRALKACRMCLTETPTAATPCGHVFCWNCLTDWLSAKSRCPFCRERVLPSRVVHLMNL